MIYGPFGRAAHVYIEGSIIPEKYPPASPFAELPNQAVPSGAVRSTEYLASKQKPTRREKQEAKRAAREAVSSRVAPSIEYLPPKLKSTRREKQEAKRAAKEGAKDSESL